MVRLEIKVIDKDSKAPIAFVPVAVGATVQVADESGTAVFEVPEGNYIVSVKPPFYRGKQVQVKAPGIYIIELESLLL